MRYYILGAVLAVMIAAPYAATIANILNGVAEVLASVPV